MQRSSPQGGGAAATRDRPGPHARLPCQSLGVTEEYGGIRARVSAPFQSSQLRSAVKTVFILIWVGGGVAFFLSAFVLRRARITSHACAHCGYDLSATDAARDDARRNIDDWWPLIVKGAEAIVMTASGCGSQVREYGHLLAHDPVYAAKAARVTELTRDISEIVSAELNTENGKARKSALATRRSGERIAVHNPCSLQHGQQLRGQRA